jgi:hypothetical protein
MLTIFFNKDLKNICITEKTVIYLKKQLYKKPVFILPAL